MKKLCRTRPVSALAGILLLPLLLTGLWACSIAPRKAPEGLLDRLPPATAQPPATAMPSRQATASITPEPTATVPARPITETVLITRSVAGRSITAQRIGRGRRILVIVGAMHGAQEANTGVLVDKLASRYSQASPALLEKASVYFVPRLNPDGIARGSRLNAHGVDLNRNWGTGNWAGAATAGGSTVYGTAGGEAPFSEPETQGLSQWLLALYGEGNMGAVIFYHSGGVGGKGVVQPGYRLIEQRQVVEPRAAELAEAFAAAVGYGYEDTWSWYKITGEAINWAAENGIPCFDVELPNYGNLGNEGVSAQLAAIVQVVER